METSDPKESIGTVEREAGRSAASMTAAIELRGELSMKRYLFLMPMILATTAAIADTQATAPSSRADAHVQAAALLSRPQTSAGVNADELRASSSSPASKTADAQAQAAALLSGARSGIEVRSFPLIAERSDTGPSADAHAQAAALLSGSRASTHSQVKAERAQDGARTTGKAL